MSRYTLNVKTNAVLEVEVSATSLKEALETKINWVDVLKGSIADGNYKVIGVSSDDWFDELEEK